MITIIPAIDLKDGRCVRLRQGRAEDSITYSEDPVEMARRWQSEGAEYLHVVDLDGAFRGQPVHTELIGRMIRAVSMPVEVGGGLRTEADLRAILACGADRAVIGTRAFSDPRALAALVREFGARLAVGIDARDGQVQVRGWVETTAMRAVDLATLADQQGVGTIIYTDTARDGMLGGVNAEAMRAMCRQVSCNVIASGGVSGVADLRTLQALDVPNLSGVIVGKALYEGTVNLKELLSVAAGGRGPG